MGVAGTGVAARHGRRAVAPRWEQAQIASDRRLHDVFLGSPVPQSTASPSGQLLDVNDSLCRLLGYTRAELLQQTVQSITDPGDVAANAAKLEELLQGLTSHFVLEKRYLRKDGTQVLALATCSLIRDAAGRPAYIAAVVQDLTERQQAKDHLRASEDLFRRIFEDSPVAQSRESLDGRFLEVNRAMCRLTGYTYEELMGLDFQALTHPDDLAANLVQWERLLSGAISEYSLEKRYRKKDGSYGPVLVTVSLVRNRDDTPAYGMIIVQDLMERDLARSAQLESAAKSRFLASMSHELRTPLNSILGFSDLLIRGEGRTDPEGRSRYLGHINAAGHHLLDMINEVLDLAKVQSGQLRLQVKPIDVAAAIKAAVAQVSPQLSAKQLVLRVTAARPRQMVMADQLRLHQVLLNLLSNAIKFTPAGGRIRVAYSASRGQVALRVIDSGVGISADRLDFVFQEFTQIDSGTRRSQEGTGLGLALSRSLVQRMGGTLRVESEVHKGSTFTVSLPQPEPSRPRT